MFFENSSPSPPLCHPHSLPPAEYSSFRLSQRRDSAPDPLRSWKMSNRLGPMNEGDPNPPDQSTWWEESFGRKKNEETARTEWNVRGRTDTQQGSKRPHSTKCCHYNTHTMERITGCYSMRTSIQLPRATWTWSLSACQILKRT